MANLKDLMAVDPFYQAGMIDLKNVKPFEADPRLQYQAAPLFTGVNPTALAAKKEEDLGYVHEGDLYVRSLDKPTMETAATTTHEGIHQVMPQELKDAVARDAGSALGPTGTYSTTDAWLEDALRRIEGGATFEDVKGDLPTRGVLGGDFARDEIMTRYLENQIYGDEVAPFEEWMGEVDPYGDEGAGAFNYITMMRPGQGPLGMEGLKKILARRMNPYLKKIAKRGHQNIESRYKPPEKPYVAPPGPHSDVSGINIQKQAIGMPEHLTTYTPPKKTYVTPPRGGGADVMPTPRSAPISVPVPAHIRDGGGGDQRGSMPTGTAGKNPWGRAHGGLIDIPLSGRRRDI